MKTNKKWKIISTINLVFFLGFFLGFIFENEDPAQFISFIELAFLIIPIPFSIFYGVFTYKLFNQVTKPNLLYTILMVIFTTWLTYYNGDGFNILLGLFFCFISLISSLVTLLLTKVCQKRKKVNKDFIDK